MARSGQIWSDLVDLAGNVQIWQETVDLAGNGRFGRKRSILLKSVIFDMLCASQIIFGKIYPLEVLFRFRLFVLCYSNLSSKTFTFPLFKVLSQNLSFKRIVHSRDVTRVPLLLDGMCERPRVTHRRRSEDLRVVVTTGIYR